MLAEAAVVAAGTGGWLLRAGGRAAPGTAMGEVLGGKLEAGFSAGFCGDGLV